MTSYLHRPPLHKRLPGSRILGVLCGALLLLGICFPHSAQAQFLGNLTEGGRYDNCTVSTSPNGKTTFKFRAQLKSASSMMAQQNKTFASWGAAVFFYDRNGNIKATPVSASAKMNQVSSSNSFYYPYYSDVRIFSGPLVAETLPAYAGNWHRLGAGPVDLEITVNSSDIADFPAISVAMAIRETQFSVFMDGRSAYLTEADSSGGGTCAQINIGGPPPIPQKKLLTVKVPDWDFGELKANDTDTDIPLTGKFCLQYDPVTIHSERLILNVSSQNGTTSQSPNMFKLVHLDDHNAVIPYAMRLRGMALPGGVYRLPNSGPAAFSAANFNPSGETCFDATYTTKTTTSSRPGSYMDVLTFTVSNPS